MKEVFISFSIFLACVALAIGSQVISPSSVQAENLPSVFQADVKANESEQSVQKTFEIDPNDPNPSLFVMANNTQKSKSSLLGGAIETQPSRRTASGLIITDLLVGDGEEATAGQNISVNYRGTLEEGKEFDSSYGRAPFTFPLGAGRVIKGWDEGVVGMKVGGKRKLVIPPELGYGQRGAGRAIPPNATLIFEVELLEIN